MPCGHYMEHKISVCTSRNKMKCFLGSVVPFALWSQQWLMEFRQKKVHCFKSFLLYAFSTLRIYKIGSYSDTENSSKLQIPRFFC